MHLLNLQLETIKENVGILRSNYLCQIESATKDKEPATDDTHMKDTSHDLGLARELFEMEFKNTFEVSA